MGGRDLCGRRRRQGEGVEGRGGGVGSGSGSGGGVEHDGFLGAEVEGDLGAGGGDLGGRVGEGEGETRVGRGGEEKRREETVEGWRRAGERKRVLVGDERVGGGCCVYGGYV